MKEKDLVQKKEATRFILRGGKDQNHKMKAFRMMEELNEIEEPYEKNGKKYIMVNRVGITTDCQLMIDIDNHDKTNFVEVLLGVVRCFPQDEYIYLKTLNGYQIISTTKEKSSYEYKNLKVLNVGLDRNHEAIYQFKKDLTDFLDAFRKENPQPEKGLFNKKLFESGLINPIGDIDYLYNILGIINGHCTIRLTPKISGDKWEQISINTNKTIVV